MKSVPVRQDGIRGRAYFEIRHLIVLEAAPDRVTLYRRRSLSEAFSKPVQRLAERSFRWTEDHCRILELIAVPLRSHFRRRAWRFRVSFRVAFGAPIGVATWSQHPAPRGAPGHGLLHGGLTAQGPTPGRNKEPCGRVADRPPGLVPCRSGPLWLSTCSSSAFTYQ